VGEVDKGMIEVTVNASGKIVPLIEEIIVSPINSRILEVYRNPGDKLNAGDPILKLDLTFTETEYRQKLDEKEMKLSKMLQSRISAENIVSEMEMQKKVKEMQLKQMETQLQNELYLDSLGASTSDKIRQALLDCEVTKLELQQLTQKIDNQRRNMETDNKVQELELSIFEKSLAQSLQLLNEARILAPQNAVLTFVNNMIGSRVSVGDQIAIISDLSSFKIESEIVDSYADMVVVGAKTTVKISDIEMEGWVANITPSVKNGMINFIVALSNPDNSKLKSGLKADVFVNHGIQANVVRIPFFQSYSGEGEYEIWVINGSQAEKRTVILGDNSYEYIAVKKGLNEGEKVILSDMSSFKKKEKLKIK
jgi:HlyD family secretion protein